MTDPAQSTLGITALAGRLGISVEALRYYEHEGLVDVSRNAAGRRVYDAAAQDALAVVLALREAGFGVHDIARFMAIKAPGSTAAERLAAAEPELARLGAALAERRAAIDRAEALLASWQREIDDYRSAGA